MSEEIKQKSFPWKIMGYFDSFEEAHEKRNSLLSENTPEDSVQAKVKRCNQGVNSFMVKSRSNPKYNLPKPKNKKKK